MTSLQQLEKHDEKCKLCELVTMVKLCNDACYGIHDQDFMIKMMDAALLLVDKTRSSQFEVGWISQTEALNKLSEKYTDFTQEHYKQLCTLLGHPAGQYRYLMSHRDVQQKYKNTSSYWVLSPQGQSRLEDIKN